MHIPIKDRCNTLALHWREHIVGNSKNSRTEHSLFIPLIQLQCKGIIPRYRGRCARLDRLEEELITGVPGQITEINNRWTLQVHAVLGFALKDGSDLIFAETVIVDPHIGYRAVEHRSEIGVHPGANMHGIRYRPTEVRPVEYRVRGDRCIDDLVGSTGSRVQNTVYVMQDLLALRRPIGNH